MTDRLDPDEAIYYLRTLADRLPMFVVYDHPADFPEVFVARLWLSLPKAEPMPMTIMHTDLDHVQDVLEVLGLTKLMRSPGDDPAIVEVWL